MAKKRATKPKVYLYEGDYAFFKDKPLTMAQREEGAARTSDKTDMLVTTPKKITAKRYRTVLHRDAAYRQASRKYRVTPKRPKIRR